MAQLVLIKTADTPFKTVGDIVSFWTDEHKPSPEELLTFDIIKIEGYTREQLIEFARNLRPQVQEVFRGKAVRGKWTFEKQDEKRAWLDGATWRFIENEPKYRFTCRNMTSQEKTILADSQSSSFEKLQALGHLEVTYKMFPENMTEVPDV